MASGMLAWWLTDQSLHRVDIWGVDWVLHFTIVSVIFTAFAVGGVANAINIIDGFNGLASTMSTLAFLGYAMIAWQVGDTTLAGVSLLLAACVWGFFWVNWPFGKLFLGDGGSYFIGFALAWVAVLLLERNPSVSAFAALAVCVHPVTEVLFSIYRRKVKKANPGHPDRLHFHSLVKRRYVARWFGQYTANIRNSITGVLIGLLTLTAIVLANLTYESTALSVLAFVGLGLGYVAFYARMQAAQRLNGLGNASIQMAAPVIVSGEDHRFLAAEQLREAGIALGTALLEPVGRNTAPALTLAALAATENGQDPVLVVTPADQTFVEKPDLQTAQQYLQEGNYFWNAGMFVL
eukprot:gene16888-16705_t